MISRHILEYQTRHNEDYEAKHDGQYNSEGRIIGRCLQVVLVSSGVSIFPRLPEGLGYLAPEPSAEMIEAGNEIISPSACGAMGGWAGDGPEPRLGRPNFTKHV